MSNFNCGKCGMAIIDSPNGYVTGCDHYPLKAPVIKCYGMMICDQSEYADCLIRDMCGKAFTVKHPEF